MADGPSTTTLRSVCRPIGFLAGAAMVVGAWVSLAAPVLPAPGAVPVRASIVEVKPRFLPVDSTPMPGAGVRAFRPSASRETGVERFDIHWYAPPPGMPAGTILMLECVHEHRSAIQNRVLRIDQRTEGHAHSQIEVPMREIVEAGRVRKWRVSLVWRGHILSRYASNNWNG